MRSQFQSLKKLLKPDELAQALQDEKMLEEEVKTDLYGEQKEKFYPLELANTEENDAYKDGVFRRLRQHEPASEQSKMDYSKLKRFLKNNPTG